MVAEQILALASSYDYFLAPATAHGKSVMPRVAAKLDVAQLSDITKVVSPDQFEHPIYAGNAIATVQAIDSKKVITVRTTNFDPANTGGSCSIESITTSEPFAASQFIGRELTKSDRPELSAIVTGKQIGRAHV